jgi:hypothetical protein
MSIDRLGDRLCLVSRGINVRKLQLETVRIFDSGQMLGDDGRLSAGRGTRCAGTEADLLSELKDRVRAARTKPLRAVNTQLIELYWSIGNDVRSQQEHQGWGSGVIKRLAEDLRAEFPEMKGFSPRNL